mgnify:CR=1 FL=1
MSLDWLIIGGGIHGVHLATRLLGEGDVSPDALRIVDPGEKLLERWLECTKITGMRHLRSPSVHHLDIEPWSLKQYAGKKKRKRSGLFVRPYSRPALPLFNAHCKSVVEHFSLENLHIRARAEDCSIDCDGVKIQLSTGHMVSAQNIVLALGSSDEPHWPDWAPVDDLRVHHVFAPGFGGWPSNKEAVALVGGGISAGQIALRLMKEQHEVHLISRHALRQHQFDSDPGWLGPKFMRGFVREQDLERRRAMITEARHKGSVPPDVRRALIRAIEKGQLHWYEDEVATVATETETLGIRLSSGVQIDAQRLLLATGFSSRRPGGLLIDRLIASASLPCATCGYPIVDESLRWHPNIYVSGPLAELELGPTSRNIAGARRAADRLVATIRSNSSVLLHQRAQ